ncbi:hypothetical protein FOMPIDRAFT_1054928 [Fomitopsis schrenkii]|uniref:DUF6533 domain-containing protein n=1 Tax=Fomitopsis schrenkii TaxID=2126942 RepID=S8DPQ9_FOMSC|nr:hypothetical protein FOMPIDRAFT_1054928 [Fomitopsis schrenkii]
MLLYNVTSTFVAKCLASAALTLTLWDHVLTLGRELQLLWRWQWAPLQLLLLANRYGAILSMVFIVKKFLPVGQGCEAVTIIITVYCCINSGSQQFSVLLYLYKLFDRRSVYRKVIVVGFAVCFSAALAFGILSVRQVFETIRKDRDIGAYCVDFRGGFEVGMWGSMLLFNVFVFLVLLVNVLHTPRRNNSEIAVRLLQEGALVFLACSGLRLSQLISTVMKAGSQSILVPLVAWSLDGVLTYRLMLKVKVAEMVAEGQLQRLVSVVEAPRAVHIYHEVDVQER